MTLYIFRNMYFKQVLLLKKKEKVNITETFLQKHQVFR